MEVAEITRLQTKNKITNIVIINSNNSNINKFCYTSAAGAKNSRPDASTKLDSVVFSDNVSLQNDSKLAATNDIGKFLCC